MLIEKKYCDAETAFAFCVAVSKG